jgi:hypothetical protein
MRPIKFLSCTFKEFPPSGHNELQTYPVSERHFVSHLIPHACKMGQDRLESNEWQSDHINLLNKYCDRFDGTSDINAARQRLSKQCLKAGILKSTAYATKDGSALPLQPNYWKLHFLFLGTFI